MFKPEQLVMIQNYIVPIHIESQFFTDDTFQFNHAVGALENVFEDLKPYSEDQDQYEQDLKGVVATIADTGVIHIRQGAAKVKIRYPMKLIKDAELLTVNKNVVLHVNTSRYYDAVVRRHVYQHTLLSVK